MKSFALVCVLSLMMMGCRNVSTRLIEVERADQDVSGNQGVLFGKVPEPKDRSDRKMRKILEVDVSRVFDN